MSLELSQEDQKAAIAIFQIKDRKDRQTALSKLCEKTGTTKFQIAGWYTWQIRKKKTPAPQDPAEYEFTQQQLDCMVQAYKKENLERRDEMLADIQKASGATRRQLYSIAARERKKSTRIDIPVLNAHTGLRRNYSHEEDNVIASWAHLPDALVERAISVSAANSGRKAESLRRRKEKFEEGAIHHPFRRDYGNEALLKKQRPQRIASIGQRETKHLAHDVLLEHAERVFEGVDRLCFITLPGNRWAWERKLSDRPIMKRIRKITGIESQKNVFEEARASLGELAEANPQCAWNLIHGLDRDLLRYGSSSELKKTKDGCHLMWLDWMGAFHGQHKDCLQVLGTQIEIFHPAWQAQKPGILAFTVQVGGVIPEDGYALSAAACDLLPDLHFEPTLDKRVDNLTRLHGLIGLVDHYCRYSNATCKPVAAIYYRDKPSSNAPNPATMLFLCFEVHQGRFDISEATRSLKPITCNLSDKAEASVTEAPELKSVETDRFAPEASTEQEQVKTESKAGIMSRFLGLFRSKAA